MRISGFLNYIHMEIKNRQIKIGNSKWKIKLEESMLSEDKESFYFGMSNAIYKEIKLSTKLPDNTKVNNDSLQETYYHEILHSILNEGQYKEESDNEPLIEWIAKCLLQLKKQNSL